MVQKGDLVLATQVTCEVLRIWTLDRLTLKILLLYLYCHLSYFDDLMSNLWEHSHQCIFQLMTFKGQKPFNFYSVIETFFKRLPVAMGEEIVRPIWEWHLEAAKRKAGCWVNKWDLSFLGGPQMEVYQKQRMKPGGWSQGVFGDPRLKAENSTPPVNFSRHPTASHIHTVGTDGSNREPASALINLEEDM